MAISTVEKKTIPIQYLVVNHENPRFEPVGSESEAIDKMLEELGDQVVRLAKDIVDHDLNPSKRLMVMALDKKKYVSLEGNRRIVALKLLHQPDLTSDERYRKKFRELKKESGTSLPGTVDCVVFPDRESAARWISLEHTGQNGGIGVVGWDREQQQRFISLLSGKKPSRAIQLIDFARENDIGVDKIETSTLDRLLTNADVRDLIGISFPKGQLELTAAKKAVLVRLEKILDAMAAKSFKVAKVYTSDLAKSWTESVLGVPTPKTKAAKGTASDTKPKRAAPPGPLDGDWISTQLYNAYPHANRVKAVLGELRGIKPDQKPNVCSTSLRVLLELATYEFLKSKGIIKTLVDDRKRRLIEDCKAKGTELQWDPTWSPSFQMMVNYLAHDETLLNDPSERKSLQTFIGKTSTEPFLIELNLFTHNPSYDPSPESVVQIWNKLGKMIFRVILAGS